MKPETNEDIIDLDNNQFCNTQGFFTQESMEIIDIEEEISIKQNKTEQTPKKSNLNSDKIKVIMKHQ